MHISPPFCFQGRQSTYKVTMHEAQLMLVPEAFEDDSKCVRGPRIMRAPFQEAPGTVCVWAVVACRKTFLETSALAAGLVISRVDCYGHHQGHHKVQACDNRRLFCLIQESQTH